MITLLGKTKRIDPSEAGYRAVLLFRRDVVYIAKYVIYSSAAETALELTDFFSMSRLIFLFGLFFFNFDSVTKIAESIHALQVF